MGLINHAAENLYKLFCVVARVSSRTEQHKAQSEMSDEQVGHVNMCIECKVG